MNNVKLRFLRIYILLSVIVFPSFGNNELFAQINKEPLPLEDIPLWRTHSLTLSDNGKWYTALYSFIDKPADKTRQNLIVQKLSSYLDQDNQTDILYISNSSSGIKYRIPHGSGPKLSSASDWIAYKVEPVPGGKGKATIELKHLASGFTVKYESNATYFFLEDKNYFVTTDKSGILIYDLDHRSEHYIGNIGEYLINKQSEHIVYTIASGDKRGNGIYLYHPGSKTTTVLHTGNFIYSNLSWNDARNALAAYKYNRDGDKIDDADMSIVVISGIGSKQPESIEYMARDMKGLNKNVGLEAGRIIWSKDDARLFIRLTERSQTDENGKVKYMGGEEESGVQIWHGKDKKLLSVRMKENDIKKYEAVFLRNSNKVVPLTGPEVKSLILRFTSWAIGKDNENNDLYRINLETGEKNLFQKSLAAGITVDMMSPDGKKAIFWDGQHYWCYDIERDLKHNISEGLEVSFINKESDRAGNDRSYGFIGWVKNQNAVIVAHKFDLWLLPLSPGSKARNLTASVTSEDSIRFRFTRDQDESGYIDLSIPQILAAYNPQTKWSGYYKLQGGKLSKLIYKPATFTLQRSGKSDAVIYTMSDYYSGTEAYLSTLDFVSSKKLTTTNPHQKKYKWGRRILINYTNNDGIPLQGILSIPEDYQKGQKLPMIVHSYEKLSDRMYNSATTTISGASVPEMLYVSDGYLFLQPDIHFNVGTPHSDMHECIDAAIAKVIELGYVDEKRIGYQGHSFGGHCGMYMSTQPNRFAAIIAGAGVSNLVQGFTTDIKGNGDTDQSYYLTGQGRMGADPASAQQLYISESPLFHASSMNTPLLLFHGTDDRTVSWQQSFGFYNILRYLKKPVIFLSYPEEGHVLSRYSNRSDLQIRMKDFFDHHLKGVEAKKWMIEETPYGPKKTDRSKNILPN